MRAQRLRFASSDHGARYPKGGIAPISHTRDTAGPMASTVADVAILDRAIAGGGAITPANPNHLRIGVVAAMLANLGGDTDAAFHSAIDKPKAAGVALVDIDMPKLAELNAQVGFPVALYEALTTSWPISSTLVPGSR